MEVTGRILLIEDDREIATTIRSVLESAGHTVQHAPNGREGKRLIDEWRPELVITDMMMPQLGGFPVLEHLKTIASPPPVIMITANEGGRHKAYAEMLGVEAYLRKPFAMDVMLEVVSQALTKRGVGKPAAAAPTATGPTAGAPSATGQTATAPAPRDADESEVVKAPRRTTRRKE
jgi:DNA-binding response OmpR family regulator